MPSLLVEERGRVVHIQLNRPEVRNAVDHEMVDLLHAVCAQLESVPRVALISGGDGIFAAGADIAQLRGRGRADALRGINSALFDRIRRLPMPTIALVDGPAIGGGAELAYACDFRIGTERTRFGNPEVSLGIAAAAGATWRLRELVGEAIAKEVLLTGRVLDATESLQLGLLNEIAPVPSAEDTAFDWARRIAKGAPLAVQLTKSLLAAPRDAHPFIDDVAQAVLFETEEKQNRMDAFLSRREDR